MSERSRWPGRPRASARSKAPRCRRNASITHHESFFGAFVGAFQEGAHTVGHAISTVEHPGRDLRWLKNKSIEQGAAALAIPTYLSYYGAYEVRHHIWNAPGLRTVERLGLHGDMYLDRVEHAHGDPRTEYDEGVHHFQLGPIRVRGGACPAPMAARAAATMSWTISCYPRSDMSPRWRIALMVLTAIGFAAGASACSVDPAPLSEFFDLTVVNDTGHSLRFQPCWDVRCTDTTGMPIDTLAPGASRRTAPWSNSVGGTVGLREIALDSGKVVGCLTIRFKKGQENGTAALSLARPC